MFKNKNSALSTITADERDNLFRYFFNLPLVGAAITSSEKGWIEVNDRTCEILGYTREELFKRNWAEITHPDDIAADVAQFERMLAGEINSYSIEKRFIRKNGDIVWTIMSGGRSRINNKDSEYFYVQILDITDRKIAEEALMAAKNEAENSKRLLELAHEQLKIYAQKEIEETRIREREQLIRDVHDGFGSQLSAIRMLAEQGGLNLEELPIHLNELYQDLHLVVDTLGQADDLSLYDAMVDMQHRLQNKFISKSPHFYWEINIIDAPKLDARKALNILRMQQEIINNALRHGAPKNIWITADYDSEKNIYLISIRDDGSGMNDKNEIRGRGISNIRQRATQMNSTVEWIEHQQGVEVIITLPHH